ncbi:MAG: RtcB family protein [Nanoarchaeota archaeon]|nr:RtcB family protein [Nanoarchaeota archaeon]
METALEKTIERSSINLLITEQVLRSTDHNTAIRDLINFLKGYNVKDIALLPDLTPANSLPVGSTVLIDQNKAINPNLIGMDIGCGYHFFSAEMNSKRFLKKGKFKARSSESIIQAISEGLKYGGKQLPKDLASRLPKEVRKEAQLQFGSLGKGNHFIDMFVVDQVYDHKSCQRHGLSEKKVYFLIHTGSRGLGFATQELFSRLFKEEINPKTFNTQYLKAVKTAVTYAFANRNYLREKVEKSLRQANGRPVDTKVIFDKSHNEIEIQYGTYKVKKGTANLKPGEMCVIPGTATDTAYVVEGSSGLENSLGTINHGVGRRYTRAQMFSKFRRKRFDHLFNSVALNVKPKKMIEEIPKGYKNVDDVMNSVEEYDLAHRIASLRPVGVIVER